jgi:hypothetical protein
VNIHYTTLGISYFSSYFINYALQYIIHTTIIEIVIPILYISVPILCMTILLNLWLPPQCWWRFGFVEYDALSIGTQLTNSLDSVIKKHVRMKTKAGCMRRKVLWGAQWEFLFLSHINTTHLKKKKNPKHTNKIF